MAHGVFEACFRIYWETSGGGMQPRVLLLVRSFSCQDTQDSFFLTDMKRLDYDDIDEDTLPRAPLLLRGIENNCYTFLSSSPHFTICYSRCWFVRWWLEKKKWTTNRSLANMIYVNKIRNIKYVKRCIPCLCCIILYCGHRQMCGGIGAFIVAVWTSRRECRISLDWFHSA